MPTNTTNLKLFKYGSTDGARTFNIDEALNANWDKIDEAVAKKYTKAPTGIPELDLDSAVKAALGKARTALQSVTKADVGLGNVDNTSDASKPISEAQAAKFGEVEGALTTHKADLVSHGIYGVATGTNALVMTDSKVTSYVDGMLVAFKNTTASTASTTLNINSLGAKAIVKANGTAVNNLKANAIYQLRYNGVNFTLLGEGGEYGNVTAADVRSTKTFGTENGVAQGTLNLSQLIPGNIKKGVTIDGVAGNLDVSTLGGFNFASGEGFTSNNLETFTTLSGVSQTMYSASASGLSFKPRIIYIKLIFSPDIIFTSIYDDLGFDIAPATLKTAHFNKAQSNTTNIFHMNPTISPAYVTSNTFKLPIIGNAPNLKFNWLAFG